MAEPVAGGGSLPSIGTSPIPITVSRPENIIFYWVQLHELEQLMKIERPFSLAIAGVTTGVWVGLLPTLQAAIHSFDDLAKVTHYDVLWDMAYFVLAALSLGISVVTWLNSFRGKSDSQELLEAIKKRPSLPMS